jgi:glycerol uptake facilitator-like aquaporin
MKKYIAELLGTFTLALVVGLSLKIAFPVSTPILAGLVLLLFVYTIGHISGTHINPAVTIGAWSIGKITVSEAVMYIISQAIGAGLALMLISQTVGLASVPVVMSWGVFGAELLGTFFFAFGIASVIYGKTPGVASGVVIGGSLLLGITVAALLGSNGILNPAVAFGIASFNWAYLLGPIVGSVAGMQAYKYVAH